MRKLLAALAAAVVFALPISVNALNAQATPPSSDGGHKWYVCKYVGTPGQFETLQTGQNPIFVDEHSIATYPNVAIGDDFADGQGHSKVIMGPLDKKLTPEPGVENCPTTPPPTTPPPTTPPPTTPPPTTPPPTTPPPSPTCETDPTLCPTPPPSPSCEENQDCPTTPPPTSPPPVPCEDTEEGCPTSPPPVPCEETQTCPTPTPTPSPSEPPSPTPSPSPSDTPTPPPPTDTPTPPAPTPPGTPSPKPPWTPTWTPKPPSTQTSNPKPPTETAFTGFTASDMVPWMFGFALLGGLALTWSMRRKSVGR